MFELCGEDVLAVLDKVVHLTKDMKNNLEAVYKSNVVLKLMYSCFFDPRIMDNISLTKMQLPAEMVELESQPKPAAEGPVAITVEEQN